MSAIIAACAKSILKGFDYPLSARSSLKTEAQKRINSKDHSNLPMHAIFEAKFVPTRSLPF